MSLVDLRWAMLAVLADFFTSQMSNNEPSKAVIANGACAGPVLVCFKRESCDSTFVEISISAQMFADEVFT